MSRIDHKLKKSKISDPAPISPPSLSSTMTPNAASDGSTAQTETAQELSISRTEKNAQNVTTSEQIGIGSDVQTVEKLILMKLEKIEERLNRYDELIMTMNQNAKDERAAPTGQAASSGLPSVAPAEGAGGFMGAVAQGASIAKQLGLTGGQTEADPFRQIGIQAVANFTTVSGHIFQRILDRELGLAPAKNLVKKVVVE